MNNTTECIFDYHLNVLELELLNPVHYNKTSYLKFTSPVKILRDLHLFFSMRNDTDGCNRINDMLQTLEELM
ncbi:MAG TPA: hypothetical protein VLN45_10990 [Ignavibacteriaceae bacterium]|nr:hypothetical protein [Ignavibacteriaceae bacterium]